MVIWIQIDPGWPDGRVNFCEQRQTEPITSMRTKSRYFCILLTWLAVVHQADAQGNWFFRISGPAATTNIAFRPDGTLVWSNTQPDTNYIIQRVSALPAGTNWVDYVQIPVTNSVNTNQIIDFNPPSGMVFVPAGVFTMGDTLDGETDAVPTNVTVSAFFMDANLVSSNQWQSVYTYAGNHGYTFNYPFPAFARAANYPVETVDWFDCVKWSNARSQQAGLTPAYYTDAGFTQVFTNGDSGATVYLNLTNNGYRLPTEAEWEKAARGGLIGQRFPWGKFISENLANYFAGGLGYDLGPYAGFNTNFDGGIPWTDQVTFSGDNSSPVGFFAPNGYGLYDMAGNVWEWCWDWYATPYGQPTANNPTGPAGPLTYRVLRGGNWINRADNARCAYRCQDYPNDTFVGVGFRCVRGL
jgi:formylglycine-generating enzyme required for sulfatase activity